MKKARTHIPGRGTGAEEGISFHGGSLLLEACWVYRMRAFWFALLLVLVLSSACSPKWVEEGDTCVMESEDEHAQKVVNYTDPELCDRYVKKRSRDHLRTEPPELEDIED